MRSTRYAEAAYAVTRLIVGFLYACHGAQKLFGAFGKPAATADPKMLVAGTIELAGGLLVAAGLFTSLAAFVASGQMAAAYFMVHAPRGFWPIENQGELAAVYCFFFLAIAAVGGGLYSLDAVRHARQRSPRTVSSAALARARMGISHDPGA